MCAVCRDMSFMDESKSDGRKIQEPELKTTLNGLKGTFGHVPESIEM